jgi:hypothetical protein
MWSWEFDRALAVKGFPVFLVEGAFSFLES